MSTAIEMVEDVQHMVWDAEAKNSDLKLTIRKQAELIKQYESRLDNLNENLK